METLKICQEKRKSRGRLEKFTVITKIFIYAPDVKKFSHTKDSVDFAMMTADGRYLQFGLSIECREISNYMANMLSRLFGPYLFTPNMLVSYVDGMDEKNPLLTYLRLVGHHVGFVLRKVKIDVMLSQTAKFLRFNKMFVDCCGKKKKVGIYNLQQLWRNIVEKEKCAWITKPVDEQIQKLEQHTKRRKQLVRIGMLYVMFRQELN